MNILLVDDDATDRALFTELVKQTEHTLNFAETTEQALEGIAKHNIDLVFLNVNAKGLNAQQCARKIKEQYSILLPAVVFIAEPKQLEYMSETLNHGDDFLVKPIDLLELRTKLDKQGARLATLRDAQQEHKSLTELKKEFDYERERVKDIFSAVIKRNKISGRHLKFIVTPTSVFGGDIILTRQDQSVTYLLIGDFTGHGLPAAIGLLPIANTFFTMVEKRLSISLIAKEINRTVSLCLPDYMFLAATVVVYDSKTANCRIWSGGMPDILLTNNEGELKERIASQHMPLGALVGEEFDDTCIELDFNIGDNIFLYTNGLVRAKNAMGEAFGDKRFKALFSKPDKFLFQRILTEINSFTAGTEKSDDISLAEITLGK